MGAVCDTVEQMVGGTALFINADAGDVAPSDCSAPSLFS